MIKEGVSEMSEVSCKRVWLLLFVSITVQQVFCHNNKMNWWIDIKLSEIKEKCDAIDVHLFDDIIKSIDNFKGISRMKYANIEEEFWNSHSPITLKYKLLEYCYNDIEMRTAVMNMTSNVQSCLKGDERMRKSNKKLIIRKILDSCCAMMELYIFYNYGTECEETMKKDASFTKCYGKYPNVWPAHSLWPLPFIHPHQVCSERTQLIECQLEVVKDCVSYTWFTHVSFKSLLMTVWSSIFCGDP